MTVSEKVAYIRGLYDGLGLDGGKSGEARILSEVLDVLRDVGLQLDGMGAVMEQLDEKLDVLENVVFDGGDDDGAGFGGSDEDESLIPCPTCGEDLLVDDEALAAGVVGCPACGGRFALSFEDGDDDLDE